MSRFIGAGLGFLGTEGILPLAADESRLWPAWLPWHHDERITAEVPYSYRSRSWPRSGLAGAPFGQAALLEGVWYDRPELTSGSPHSPLVGTPGAVTADIYIRIGMGQLITIEGRDPSEAVVPLEDQRFMSKTPEIFTSGPNPLDPFNRYQALLTAVQVGTGTLFIRADGDPSEVGQAPIGVDYAVIVVTGPATHLVFYWTEAGQNRIVLPQDIGTVLLPMNRTATLTVEGLDGEDGVVTLASQLFVGSGTYFSVTTTADPNTVTITPIGTGPYDPVVFTADADPGPAAPEIVGIVQVQIVAAVPIADHLAVTAAPVDL